MWYRCVFFHRLLDYRKSEVEALAELFGAFEQEDGTSSLQWKLLERGHPDSPFHLVHLPSEDIPRNVAARSILVEGIYKLWGEGSNYQELDEAVNAYDDERKLPYLAPGSTFRINIDSFGKMFNTEVQKERIDSLSFIPFKDDIRWEVHTMTLIDHPNLLRAHCSFTAGHNLWVVMPYMAGGSCQHIMKSTYIS